MKSRRLEWRIGLAISLVLVLSGCSDAYPAQYLPEDPSPPSLCYTATGHTIRGNFLRYFEAMGGLQSLGYPITEAFEQEGRLVQYFEYARLEDHPDNPGQPVVKLSMLGERLGRRQPPLRPGLPGRHGQFGPRATTLRHRFTHIASPPSGFRGRPSGEC